MQLPLNPAVEHRSVWDNGVGPPCPIIRAETEVTSKHNAVKHTTTCECGPAPPGQEGLPTRSHPSLEPEYSTLIGL
jgi:hypothetical protein